jgi:hypothetical protein
MSSRCPRIIVVVLAVCALANVVQVALPAASADPPSIACPHTGTVRPTPGLSSVSRAFSFSFKGLVGPCRASDGSTLRGVESGSGKADGNCVTRTATAAWTIVWNTGARTVVKAAFNGALNVINTSGPIVTGAFAGSMFEDGHVLSGFAPTDCLSAGGVTKATYQGAFLIVPRG